MVVKFKRIDIVRIKFSQRHFKISNSKLSNGFLYNINQHLNVEETKECCINFLYKINILEIVHLCSHKNIVGIFVDRQVRKVFFLY